MTFSSRRGTLALLLIASVTLVSTGAVAKAASATAPLVVCPVVTNGKEREPNYLMSEAAPTGCWALAVGRDYVDGVVAVGFLPGSSSAQIAQALRGVNGTDIEVFAWGDHVISVPSGSVPQAVVALRSLSFVSYSEPSYLDIQVNDTTPADPSYNQQWADHNTGQTIYLNSCAYDACPPTVVATAGDMSAQKAWDVTTGDAANPVVVAFIDSGVDQAHQDLQNQLWNNTSGLWGCGTSTHGYNLINNSCLPADDCVRLGGPDHHGTNTAGLLGAQWNNGSGIAGVIQYVRIMEIKAFDNRCDIPNGDATLASAINKVLQAWSSGVNVRVINASWGLHTYSALTLNAVNQAGNDGILFVESAGNDGWNLNGAVSPSAQYPCSYTPATLICVGATDITDARWSSATQASNYGNLVVDVGAQGQYILTTQPGNAYRFVSATSFASPQVAGVAALMFSADPSLSPADVKWRIKTGVDTPPALSGVFATSGRLNAYGSICIRRASHPGVYDTGAPGSFYLRSCNTAGQIDINIQVSGTPASGCTAVSGNWLGSAYRGVGLYCAGTWYLKYYNSSGGWDAAFNYGGAWSLPVVGDFCNQGHDGIAVYGNTPDTAGNWYIRCSASPGIPDLPVFQYGWVGAQPVTGRWNAGQASTVGVFGGGGYWYLRNSNDSGRPDILYQFGNDASTAVVGDWTNKAYDSAGYWSGGVWSLKNCHCQGSPDIQFTYGNGGFQPIRGRWSP